MSAYAGGNENVKDLKVGFASRPYGRGTDFVCRDEGLRKNGGPSPDSQAAWLGPHSTREMRTKK